MKLNNLKQKAMATVIVAAFSAAGTSAYAMTATNGAAATQKQVISNLFKSAAATIAVGDLTIASEASDSYMGRTTGFNVVVTLSGAKFANIANAPTASAALAVTSWAIAKAGGGTGSNVVTYSFTPSATANGIIAGNMFAFATGDIVLSSATNLATTGGKVTATITFNDPVGGATLATKSVDLITSVDGVLFTSNTGTSTTKRIDVGTDSTHASKSYFSTDGTIKKLDAGTFAAGSFTLAPGTGTCFHATAGGTIVSAYCDDATAAGVSSFNTALSTVTVTLTGTNMAAFRMTGASVFIASGAETTCSGGPTKVAEVTAGSTGSTTSITLPAYAIGTTGATYSVCLSVPAPTTNSIVAQTLGVSVAVDLGDTDLTNPSAFTGTLYPLAYNGTVREAYFFNPSSNTVQTSLLRVVNPSTTNGTVTVTGVDDKGVASGTVTFTLSAGNAVMYSASELETGAAGTGKPALTGSMGTIATDNGKRHLTVTGEFSSMQAMSLTRDTNGILNNFSNTINPPVTIQNAN